jgi:hypothetical protein
LRIFGIHFLYAAFVEVVMKFYCNIGTNRLMACYPSVIVNASNISSVFSKTLCWLLLLAAVYCFSSPVLLYSQVVYKPLLNAGCAFNHNLVINQQPVKESRAFHVEAGGMVEFPVYRTLMLQTGIAGMAIWSRGTIGISGFESSAIKLAIPFMAGIGLNDDLFLFSGLIIQNNRDLKRFNVNHRNNLRYNFVIGGEYMLNQRVGIQGQLKRSINTPQGYLIHDPKISISAGVSFRINPRKEKSDF